MHDRADTHDDPRIPEGLAAGLGRLDARHRADWPADDPVLAAVGETRGRRWTAVGWSAGLTAAAAGLAISAIVWFGRPGSQSPARLGPASPVTMLDAYRLRLMLDGEQAPGAAWDADGDGRVDGADVETLAARAVRLGEASS